MLAGNGTSTSSSSSYQEAAIPTPVHSLDGLPQSYGNSPMHATSMEELCQDTLTFNPTQTAANAPASPSNQSVEAEPQPIDQE